LGRLVRPEAFNPAQAVAPRAADRPTARPVAVAADSLSVEGVADARP
jgi:hypothetical protein